MGCALDPRPSGQTQSEIFVVILAAKKHLLSTVSSLGDVMWDSRYDHFCQPRHGRSIALIGIASPYFSEIRFGIELIGDPERRAELHHWLDQRLRPLFDRRALPVTEDILLSCANRYSLAP